MKKSNLLDAEVELRVRNNQLKQRREMLGLTQKELSKRIGITAHTYSGYETLRKSPLSADGGWKPSAKQVAKFFGESLDSLFPAWLYDVPSVKASYRLSAGDVAGILAVQEPLALPDESVSREQVHTILLELLGELPANQQLVVKLRYGIDCDRLTLREASEKLGLPVERIRQIEQKALAKLQHPVRSNRLRRAEGREIGMDP